MALDESLPDDGAWPLQLLLSSGSVLGCDVVVRRMIASVSLPVCLPNPLALQLSATGVDPVAEFVDATTFKRGSDGGLLVNESMQTSGKVWRSCQRACTARTNTLFYHLCTASDDVYAAGDVCSMEWPESKDWFQMRLWSQVQ